MDTKLYNGDCLEIMDELIQQGIKVDAIITDPPYGVSHCKWDIIIPFDKMWERLNKLIKDNRVIALFGIEPFLSKLRLSNINNYKYDWIWDKKCSVGFLNAKKRPLKRYETISIFSNKKPVYYPIMRVGKYRIKGIHFKEKYKEGIYGELNDYKSFNNLCYPTDIIEISNAIHKGKEHPTQKPVSLMEYLIKTYTQENETVLDFTMGSGSTGVACVNTNRNFIGIELDKKYFEIAEKRIKEAKETIFDMI